MSLASLLVGKQAAAVDTDLDAVFRTSFRTLISPQAGPSTTTPPHVSPPLKRRADSGTPGESPRRTKQKKAGKPVGSQQEETGTVSKKRKQQPSDAKAVVHDGTPKMDRKKMKKQPGDTQHARAYDGVDVSDVEKAVPATSNPAHASEDDTDTEDAETSATPVHESLTGKGSKAARGRTTKYVPPDETRDQRDARTVFVGNLPLEIVKSRPMLKQLKRHIIADLPGAKIESTRFRSVAFKNPTAKIAADDAKGAPAAGPSTKQQRQQERASTWRDKQPGDEHDPPKNYLTPQEKRKVAFIKGELHEHADGVHAYVVFAHTVPDDQWPKNVPRPLTMDPYEAARLAVQKGDGSTFAGRTIRVDAVSKGPAGPAAGGTDPKLSIFVGNLDFASKEEDLRMFFEGLVSAERGAPADEESDDDNGVEEDKAPRQKSWVTRVRIVKDRDTQLGKGFAYIQFADRECVDEVLALDQDRVKFAKRKLRVQRCKVGGGAVPRGERAARPNAPTATRKSTTILQLPPIPKGNPLLGEKLAGLSKEARKQTKAADPARLARRLAKKKARNALEKAGVKARARDRTRERPKKTSGAGGKVNTGKRESKGRVRSDKTLLKRNAKKQ